MKVRVVLIVAVAAALLAGPAAADPPPLYVVFKPDHTFLVYLSGGQQVGTTNGTSSVISAGTYTLLLDDTAAVDMPFHLAGPGVSLVTDMAHAEEVSEATVVTFQPSSTYTYRDDNLPNVVWTFTTSSTVLPSSPSTTTTCSSCTVPGGTSGSGDVVGSEVVPARGALAATVSADGGLALTFKGKAAGSLEAGSYTVTVTDRNAKRGFSLQRLHKAALALTGAAFTGKKTRKVTLTAGQWTFFSPGGKRSYFLVVAR